MRVEIIHRKEDEEGNFIKIYELPDGCFRVIVDQIGLGFFSWGDCAGVYIEKNGRVNIIPGVLVSDESLILMG